MDISFHLPLAICEGAATLENPEGSRRAASGGMIQDESSTTFIPLRAEGCPVGFMTSVRNAGERHIEDHLPGIPGHSGLCHGLDMNAGCITRNGNSLLVS